MRKLQTAKRLPCGRWGDNDSLVVYLLESFVPKLKAKSVSVLPSFHSSCIFPFRFSLNHGSYQAWSPHSSPTPWNPLSPQTLIQDSSRITFSWPFSYISFSSFPFYIFTTFLAVFILLSCNNNIEGISQLQEGFRLAYSSPFSYIFSSSFTFHETPSNITK